MPIDIFCDIILRMKRSIWFWLCFIITIIFGIYFATRIVMVATGHGPLARVRNISISSDARDQNLSAIAAATSIAPNTPVKSVDLDTLKTRISAVPGVKDCAVRRLPNGNIIIRTNMHHTVALWTDGENYFPLSADGTIVNTPTNARNIADVVFRGPVPNDISEITRAAHNLVGNIDYMEWIENRRWNIHTTGGITVMLPETNPESAINTLMTLNTNHRILGKAIKVIDMRDDARILVK